LALKALAVIVLWLFCGAILGYCGVQASSHIPVVVLGFIFGCSGAVVHTILLAKNIKPFPLLPPVVITVVAFIFTLLFGTPSVLWLYAIVCYFVFGALIYLLAEGLLRLLFNSNKQRRA